VPFALYHDRSNVAVDELPHCVFQGAVKRVRDKLGIRHCLFLSVTCGMFFDGGGSFKMGHCNL
jgi:hypothetical protein